MPRRVLIAGASGVVGTSAMEEFLCSGWDVVAISRRKPEVAARRPFRHLAVDLRDAAACQSALGALHDIDDVVFAALYEKPGLVAGWSEEDQMQTNLSMLRNCLDALADSSRIQHVSLMQGTKAYGLHLHPISIPAREREPRDPHANFYWLQEDYLKAKAAACDFAFTILRPQMVMGSAYSAAMNVAPVLGAYAAICREEKRPFGFPGGPPFVWEATDARIVAKALVWSARTPAAHGEHFNVTNGDVFEWRSVWPAIAQTLGVPAAADSPCELKRFLPEKSALWDRIVTKHRLRPISLQELLGESHHLADFCFAYGALEPPPPAFISTIKIRQAGFNEVIDTEDMFRYWLANFIERRIVPGPVS